VTVEIESRQVRGLPPRALTLLRWHRRRLEDARIAFVDAGGSRLLGTDQELRPKDDDVNATMAKPQAQGDGASPSLGT
jgi:hypothetical protein